MKASDLIILSDIDGTLILPDGTVPRRNREAIARFQANGGRFSIATGRSVLWVKPFAEKIGVNAPCICFNGGIIYDFNSGNTLLSEPLPEHAKAYTEIFINSQLPVGLMVMTGEGYYNVGLDPSLNPDLVEGFNARGYGFLDEEPWQSIVEPWYKLLIVINEDDYIHWRERVNSLEAPGVYFTFSAPHLMEMMPERVNKGYAVDYMVENLGYRREQIACIGDFYNDLEMIKKAGIGVTTAEAPDDIKAAADYITGPYENGAVADIIEHLENTYGY